MNGVLSSFIYAKCMDIYMNDKDKREREESRVNLGERTRRNEIISK